MKVLIALVLIFNLNACSTTKNYVDWNNIQYSKQTACAGGLSGSPSKC